MQTARISIGRSTDNNYVVADNKVSGHHAEIVRDETGNTFIIDLDSSNGTQVNGVDVKKKKVGIDDQILLGNSYKLTVRNVYRSMNDYSEDFAELKGVYEKYQKDKNHIQSSGQLKSGLMRSLPFALPGIAGLALTLGKHPALTALSAVVSIGAPILGMLLATKQTAKIPEKMSAAQDQFKIDYVCPKCGTFLGELPWGSLAKRKSCQCKARWIREDDFNR